MDSRKKEIHTLETTFPINGVSFSVRPQTSQRVAVSSFVEEYINKVQIFQFEEHSGSFSITYDITHPYPASKIMFLPDSTGTHPDYVATAADYLRLWSLQENGNATRLIRFDNDKGSEYCAPVTSFDWSELNVNSIVASSIDTTCTVWDVAAEKAVTQLIAHDREVYDVAFHPKNDKEFASVGADGSLRMFDLRSLDHSTIMYETPSFIPLLRLSWNHQDPNFIATIVLDSNKVVVLDMRMPSIPVVELPGHTRCINSICWAPHSACHIASGADDGYVFIWDLSVIPQTTTGPLLAYNPGPVPGCEINQLCWPRSNTKWILSCFGDKLQMLRI